MVRLARVFPSAVSARRCRLPTTVPPTTSSMPRQLRMCRRISICMLASVPRTVRRNSIRLPTKRLPTTTIARGHRPAIPVSLARKAERPPTVTPARITAATKRVPDERQDVRSSTVKPPNTKDGKPPSSYQCHRCQKYGHFAADCTAPAPVPRDRKERSQTRRTYGKNPHQHHPTNLFSPSSPIYFGALDLSQHKVHNNLKQFSLTLNTDLFGVRKMMVDTGSSACAISSALARTLPPNVMLKHTRKKTAATANVQSPSLIMSLSEYWTSNSNNA